MTEVPFPWCIYQDNQFKATQCGRITDRSWGIENGLTHFLAAVEAGGVAVDQEDFRRGIDRAIATGSWNERNRARLRSKYLPPSTEPHADRWMIARGRLAEIRSSVSAADWGLLMAVAAGLAHHEIASAAGVTAGSIRTRISRLRARLCKVARPMARPVEV